MIDIKTTPILLASQSPRRQELLRLLFPDFAVCATNADETIPDGLAPDAAVELLALRKARAAARDGTLVIGADTVVVVDSDILGKPADEQEAAQMLRRLSGRTHIVHTGVALVYAGQERVFSQATGVRFSPLCEEEIDWYLATGEPFDKAGGYGIQGLGARFIQGIGGDYYNVMGLPICRLYAEIGEFTKEIRL